VTVTAPAVWTDGKLVMADPVVFFASLRRAEWGEGEALTVRVGPEEEALREGQRRYYFGQIVRPLSEWNGDSVGDWHKRLKAEFMPPGKTSLRRLSYQDMKDYTLRCEVYAREEHPEAFGH